MTTHDGRERRIAPGRDRPRVDARDGVRGAATAVEGAAVTDGGFVRDASDRVAEEVTRRGPDGGADDTAEHDPETGAGERLERPADCSCDVLFVDDGRQLPCFPCFSAGFETPNPDVTG